MGLLKPRRLPVPLYAVELAHKVVGFQIFDVLASLVRQLGRVLLQLLYLPV